MFASLKAFFADDCGATAIEYGLIGALVSVSALTALSSMGEGLQEVFNISSTSIEGALPDS